MEMQVKMIKEVFQENSIQVCVHRYCEQVMAFDTLIFHGPSDFTLTLLLLLNPFRLIFPVLRLLDLSHDFAVNCYSVSVSYFKSSFCRIVAKT